MPTAPKETEQVLILGVGNTLLSDDGVGIRVTEILRREGGLGAHVSICDGGTIGLALLPQIEQAERLIVVDAAQIDAAPGAVRTYENAHMDAHLSRSRSTVHEVALSDILDAARLSGTAPKEQVLVAIQPQVTGWGDAPTEAVAEAIPQACRFVRRYIKRWSDACA